MKRKILTALTLTGVLAFSIAGCGKKADTTAQVTTTQAPTTAVTTEEPKNENLSLLTGKPTDEDVLENRIVCMMINNIDVAMPQTGISKADIMYECVVEGGITRLMGVFQDYDDLKKVGPVRSARHYYVDFANEYDAIYAHFGQTKYATAEIEDLGINTLSGLSSIGGSVYFRDPNRVAPHNAYASGKGIRAGIKKSKYEGKNTLSEPRFSFNTEAKELEDSNSKSAKVVDLKFNDYSHPNFKYSTKKKLYYRSQYGAKQIDDATGKQLRYKNIIIQFTPYSDIDKNGYQDVSMVGSGKGYYVTEGKYIPITWKKGSKTDMTEYYTEDGSELQVNPGKTWISIFPASNKKGVTFK